MTQIPVFTSTETPSQISPFVSFVFTFYLNELVFGANQLVAPKEKSPYICSAC